MAQRDAINHISEQLPLLGQNLCDSLLHSVGTEIGVYMHWSNLPYAVRAVFRLRFHCRVPPAVKVENEGCRGKIRADPTDAK